LFASTTIGTAWADQDDRKLDHVFVIMMENHGYKEIIGSPYMPFTNKEAAQANSAKNYFAVAHPSLTNYLEVVGGSNFGILNDKSPNWGSTSCTSTLRGGPSNESSSDASICPVSGDGIDEATPVLDERPARRHQHRRYAFLSGRQNRRQDHRRSDHCRRPDLE